LLGADILKDLVDNYPLFLEISYKRKRELFEQEIDKFVEIYKPIATNPYLVETNTENPVE
jgi:hypothetical protein